MMLSCQKLRNVQTLPYWGGGERFSDPINETGRGIRKRSLLFKSELHRKMVFKRPSLQTVDLKDDLNCFSRYAFPQPLNKLTVGSF